MDKQVINRIIFYVIFLGAAGYAGYWLYTEYFMEGSDLLGGQEPVVSHQYSGTELETDILDDQKFKDLREVEVVDEDKDKDKDKDKLTPGDVAKIERRHSNPFKPFAAAQRALESEKQAAQPSEQSN